MSWQTGSDVFNSTPAVPLLTDMIKLHRLVGKAHDGPAPESPGLPSEQIGCMTPTRQADPALACSVYATPGHDIHTRRHRHTTRYNQCSQVACTIDILGRQLEGEVWRRSGASG